MRIVTTMLAALTAAGVALGALVPAQAQQPLRLGFIPVMGAAQIFVAEGEGWIKQAGLTLNTAPSSPGQT